MKSTSRRRVTPGAVNHASSTCAAVPLSRSGYSARLAPGHLPVLLTWMAYSFAACSLVSALPLATAVMSALPLSFRWLTCKVDMADDKTG